MKKYLFLLLIGMVGLTACGDDDDPNIPELNKLTKISCYKDGATTPLFVTDITYTTEGKISNMNFSGDRKLLFIYSDGKFTVTDLGSGTTTAEYALSGNVITGMKRQKVNELVSNEVYVSDEYVYRYSGSNLSMTSWKTRWPKEVGTGYEERDYPEYEKYTWENKNVVLYAKSLDDREMRYEYSVEETPKNFPLRTVGSFSPVGFDPVSPLNTMYGNRNRNLMARAYTYQIPNQKDVKSEYIYTYKRVGDYITGMTIEEKTESASSTYDYVFEYNYEFAPKK